jgi:hypothetical protein
MLEMSNVWLVSNDVYGEQGDFEGNDIKGVFNNEAQAEFFQALYQFHNCQKTEVLTCTSEFYEFEKGKLPYIVTLNDKGEESNVSRINYYGWKNCKKDWRYTCNRHTEHLVLGLTEEEAVENAKSDWLVLSKGLEYPKDRVHNPYVSSVTNMVLDAGVLYVNANIEE